MRMVFHPESLAEQFPNVYEDGVPSWSIFYVDRWCPILVISRAVQTQFPKIFLLMWMVSHPGHSSMLMDGVPSWSWHQKLQEEFLFSGNKTIYASD